MDERAAPISPVAQTVPLAEEGRATNGLPAEESQRLGEGTSRLRRTEMEDLLRRVAREHASGGGGGDDAHSYPSLDKPADGAEPSAPLTNALQTLPADKSVPAHRKSAPADAIVPAKTGATADTSAPSEAVETADTDAPAATTLAASPEARRTPRPRRWQWAAIILLCVSLAAGLLALISSRRSKASDVSGPATAPAGEEQPQAAAETGALEIEPVKIETPPPVNTPPAPPPERTREASESAAHPAAPQTPVGGQSVAPPLPSPPAGGQTAAPPVQPPASRALSATDHYQRGVQMWESDRRSALEEFRAAVPAVADAYYYLGSEYYSEGRDPKSLNDGELRAALNYFLRATSGPHSAQANRHAQLLGKEYERRKKKQSR
jgi:hypothetical protein